MDFVLDALLDSLKLLPFLFVAYIAIEVIEYFSASRLEHSRLLTGKYSTLFAASFGLVPQCGFSVVATDLYSSNKLKIGTLLAVYIATSDEAVPLLLMNPNKILSLLPLLLIKFVLAIIIGYSVDAIFKKTNQKRLESANHAKTCNLGDPSTEIHEKVEQENNQSTATTIKANSLAISTVDSSQIAHDHDEELGHDHETDHELGNENNHEHEHEHECEHDESSHHKGCCGHDIDLNSKGAKAKKFLLHPLIHTLKIFAFILIVNLILGGIIELIGMDKLMQFLASSKGFAPLISCIIGLIPNCASSVVITELYTMGGIGFGACIAGLIVNAGIAFVVLFKQNKNIKQNFAILGAMLAIGIITGYIIQLIGF